MILTLETNTNEDVAISTIIESLNGQIGVGIDKECAYRQVGDHFQLEFYPVEGQPGGHLFINLSSTWDANRSDRFKNKILILVYKNGNNNTAPFLINLSESGGVYEVEMKTD